MIYEGFVSKCFPGIIQIGKGWDGLEMQVVVCLLGLPEFMILTGSEDGYDGWGGGKKEKVVGFSPF